MGTFERLPCVIAAGLLLVWGTLVGAQTVGQSGTADSLGLELALRLAASSSPAMQRADADAWIASGEVRTLGQWPNPTLEYRRENIGAPIQPDEFVTAYIPIDVTGRRLALARATRRGVERTAAQRMVAHQDAELAIARAWTVAALSADLARSTLEQHDAVDRVADIDAKRAVEGVVGDAVAMRTRVEANRLAHELALAESRALRDRLELASLLGVTESLLPPLPSVLTAELPRLLAAGDTARLLEQAQQDRPELRAALLSIEEAQLRRRVEAGAIIGDWQLQGGSKRTSGFLSGQLGLAVPLPLFNRNSGARERSEGAMLLADAVYRETRSRVRVDVLTAADRVRRLEALTARLGDSPRLGREIAASARIAYAEGHMSLVELLDAERAAADARNSARTFRADLLLAHLTLRRAIGAPLVPGVSP